MIDSSLAAALTRVAQRAHDVLHGYEGGFEPQSADVGAPPTRLPDVRPLAMTAPNGAYFVVARDGRVLFTRDGAFRFDGGVLRTADGSAVLGHRFGDRDGRMRPLIIDAIDVALKRVHDPQIAPDGTMTVLESSIDPTEGRRLERRVGLGRIALASFPAGTMPVRVDDHHVVPPSGVPAQLGVPADGTFGALATNSRELGKVDLETGLRRLQEAYLSLEALQTAYRSGADFEKGALDLLK